jgi:hypothetical protein
MGVHSDDGGSRQNFDARGTMETIFTVVPFNTPPLFDYIETGLPALCNRWVIHHAFLFGNRRLVSKLYVNVNHSNPSAMENIEGKVALDAACRIVNLVIKVNPMNQKPR